MASANKGAKKNGAAFVHAVVKETEAAEVAVKAATEAAAETQRVTDLLKDPWYCLKEGWSREDAVIEPKARKLLGRLGVTTEALETDEGLKELSADEDIAAMVEAAHKGWATALRPLLTKKASVDHLPLFLETTVNHAGQDRKISYLIDAVQRTVNTINKALQAYVAKNTDAKIKPCEFKACDTAKRASGESQKGKEDWKTLQTLDLSAYDGYGGVTFDSLVKSGAALTIQYTASGLFIPMRIESLTQRDAKGYERTETIVSIPHDLSVLETICGAVRSSLKVADLIPENEDHARALWAEFGRRGEDGAYVYKSTELGSITSALVAPSCEARGVAKPNSWQACLLDLPVEIVRQAKERVANNGKDKGKVVTINKEDGKVVRCSLAQFYDYARGYTTAATEQGEDNDSAE